MTNHEINKISNKVAEIVITALEKNQKEWDNNFIRNIEVDLGNSKYIVDHSDTEQKLLTDLAEAMTALDYNLKLERYDRCSTLQKEIIDLENKLKNFK